MTDATTCFPEEARFLVAGLSVAARIWGPPNGLPVLALHGWMDNAATFDRVAPLLPGLRLVCLDMPGHGRSDHRPPSAEYDFVQWLSPVLAVADALGWQQFDLLGHSLGGAIALVLAGVEPDRVTRVAAIDSIGPLTRDPEQTPDDLLRAIRQRLKPLDPNKQRRFSSLDDAARFLMLANPALDLPAARTLVGRGTRPTDGGHTWRHDPRLRQTSLLRLSDGHLKAIFTRVKCPALVLRPDRGWPVDPSLVDTRLSWLGSARLEHLPGRHHVHLTDPGPCAALLRPFFGLDGADHAG